MPISLQALRTRSAISPRFAIRIFRNIRPEPGASLLPMGSNPEERLAIFNRMPIFDENARDLARYIGFNFVHQLHGLDNAQHLTRFYAGAKGDEGGRLGARRGVEGAHDGRLDDVNVLWDGGFACGVG